MATLMICLRRQEKKVTLSICQDPSGVSVPIEVWCAKERLADLVSSKKLNIPYRRSLLQEGEGSTRACTPTGSPLWGKPLKPP
jgi:predicted metal-dependent hydrolase